MRKEAAITEWKKLYELATEIKALEPWKYFWDMDVIHLIDEDAYISILGRNGEAYGISVYEGERGLNDFKILASQDELNISPQFAMYLQNNLTCYWGDREELSAKQRDIIKELGYKYRGRNQWLYFMSFKTEYIPYNFDRDEVLRMTKYFSALSEALKLYIQKYTDISFEQENMLCFSSKTEKISFEKYFSKDIGFNGIDMANDEELIAALKKLPKKLNTIEIDILPLPIRIDDKAFDRPANPTMCMIADKSSGMVLASELSQPGISAFVNLANTFVNCLFSHGLPKKICVCNSFTASILDDICSVLNIKFELKPSLSAIDEAFESFRRFML